MRVATWPPINAWSVGSDALGLGPTVQAEPANAEQDNVVYRAKRSESERGFTKDQANKKYAPADFPQKPAVLEA